MTKVQPEPTSWAETIAAELHRLADDFARTATGDLPMPRSISLSIQPGGPHNDADDQVIATVDAIGAAVLGKTGSVIALSAGGFHYRSGGARGPVEFMVFREISAARAERIEAGSVLAEKEAELARLRAEVEKLRADRGLDYSRPADDPTPVSGARVEPHVGAVTESGLVDVGEFLVSHGPVKPPYGSPEREAYDREHGSR